MTGSKWRTAGGTHPGSGVEVSANPATSLRLLMPLAWPLVPPSVGSVAITPLRQITGKHTRESPDGQKVSPSGSGVEVSENPTISSLSLIEFAQLAGRLSAGARVPR